jgi:hypothetical protein
MGIVTMPSTPEPCAILPLAHIGSYSCYHRAFHISHLSSFFPSLLSPPLPSSLFTGPCNLLVSKPGPPSPKQSGIRLKGREYSSGPALAYARWPCEEGRVCLRDLRRSLVGAGHTLSALFPTFPRRVTWNRQRCILAQAGRSFY